ncbi:MAG TPA: hypothetical protein VKS78_12890 [Roseiarcus sp.]|nr:hypothetical protein [Roseiarcus sp.]
MINAYPRSIAIAAFCAIVLAAGGAGAASASKEPTKLKPPGGPTIAVTVTNQRTVGVSELDIALAGSPSYKPIVRKLGPGRSTVVTLSHDEDCRFDLYVKYDDGATSQISALDVCQDGKINLVE